MGRRKETFVGKGRMEAFSDGVIAILITIMVFDLKAPTQSDFSGLSAVLPNLLTYLLSFLYLGIYWNNHHHMLQVTSKINGAVLWANLHLMFWLSLFPFATTWLRSSHFASLPAAVYGTILLLAAIAHSILQQTIISAEGPDSRLKQAIGSDLKGRVSMLVYLVGIGCADLQPLISIVCYVAVAMIWLIPDRRIEAPSAAIDSRDS